MLPVVLSYTRQTSDYYGLVDSSAERSACPVAVARATGIDIDAFPVERIRGIGGILRARRCPIDLLILGRRIGTEILVVETNTVILGRHGVFAAFLLIEPY